MKRRHILCILIGLIGLIAMPAQPAFAQTAQEKVVRQLRAQGFEDIEISRTLLGRVRIIAIEDDTLREIILNPSTGVILRDYWTEVEDDDDDDDDDDDGKDRDRGDDEDDAYLLDSDDRDDDD